jgi:hypothetical protein
MTKGIMKCNKNFYETAVWEFLETEYLQCIRYLDADGVSNGRKLRNSGMNEVWTLQFCFLWIRSNGVTTDWILDYLGTLFQLKKSNETGNGEKVR